MGSKEAKPASPVVLITHRRCARCRQVLPVASFRPKNKLAKDGVNQLYFSYCRPCEAIYLREYKAARRSEKDLVPESVREERNAKRRAYYASRKDVIGQQRRARYAANREAINAQQRARYAAHREEINAQQRARYAAHREEINAKSRETYRIKRASAGKRFNQSNHPDQYGRSERRVLVDIGPFWSWVKQYCEKRGTTITEMSVAAGFHQDTLRKKGLQRQISLHLVDQFLTALDSETQLWELYPEAGV